MPDDPPPPGDPESDVQLPVGPWVLHQTWADLLFVHYRVAPHALKRLIPPTLTLDTFRGNAFLSVVALRLERFGLRGGYDLPGLAPFAQVNLRTYVRSGTHRGIFFFSIDAGSAPAVLGARVGFLLPYHPARVSHQRSGDDYSFRSDRLLDRATFAAEWTVEGDEQPLEDPLDRFLLVRDQYLARLAGPLVLRGAVQHPPWNVRRVSRCNVDPTSSLPGGIGLHVDAGRPYKTHHASVTEARCWWLAGASRWPDPMLLTRSVPRFLRAWGNR